MVSLNGRVAFCFAVMLSWSLNIEGARILGFFATPSKSHVIVHVSIARALADRGHELTVITTIPFKVNHPKIKHLYVDSGKLPRKLMQNWMDDNNSSFNFIGQAFTFVSTMMEINDKAIKDVKVQKLMKEDQFDLLLLGYFLTDFHLGLAAHFKCPSALIWLSQPFGLINDIVGNPAEISYVPSAFLTSKQPLNFLSRLKNVLLLMTDYVMGIILRLVMKSYYDSNFNSSRYPSFDDMRRNVSLILVNHHFTQGPIRPNVPALVEIGGIQVKSKPDPLPEDIRNFLDRSSQNGAIYFSLGSNAYSSDLSPQISNMMFKVFSNLKENVMWKWENDKIPGNASNILFKDWFPQDDILAHRNLKLFITHGGKGGITESEYHGVPMLALPIFADQETNSNQVVDNEFGLSLNIHNLTEDAFKSSILELLKNPKYKENVKRFSSLYKDRPQSAQETAVFWIEYVIRHKGARHMQSPLIHMNFFERNSLDVLAMLLFSSYIVLKIFIFCAKLILSKFRKGDKEIKKKNE